jgi:hypothetical protein
MAMSRQTTLPREMHAVVYKNKDGEKSVRWYPTFREADSFASYMERFGDPVTLYSTTLQWRVAA